jgi:uncharacterized protein
MSQSTWRSVCQRAAAEQARQEAQRAWNLNEGQTVPFDHRWEHVQEVVRLAMLLAAETGADPVIVEAAAWLHDVCKGERAHATLGAAASERILAGTDFPAAKLPAVAEAIRQHEGLFRPKNAPPLHPIVAAVLWDADKLSKLGVQALAFVLSGHYLAGRTLVERRRNCQEYVEKTLGRTVRSMNTAPARQWAEVRYDNMLTMLALWREEERSLPF